MQRTTVVVIGAGQAGLAMSQELSRRAIDHIVLERGEPANSWRTERWDSLRLLTPNWLSRLPGWRYQGHDPDGYMTSAEVAAFLQAYAQHAQAPVQSTTAVERVDRDGHGFVVHTDRGPWRCRSVVVATGACSTPKVPALAEALPARVQQIAPIHYRNPDQVGPGRVLVVGASASGVQIADELHRSGREVTLAVSDHVRLPRCYRGMDIHWWMDAIGQLDERWNEVPDIARARRLPSLQLVGSPERRTLDLNTLRSRGVELVGRLGGVTSSDLQFSGSLPNVCNGADLKERRLLDRIDEFAHARGLDAEIGPIDRPLPTDVGNPRTIVPLAVVDTVVWATGFRPNYPWLPDDLLDHKGAIRHDGGVMAEPGMYVLGLPFLRRRKSSFIDGVGPDARDLAEHLSAHLHVTAACA